MKKTFIFAVMLAMASFLSADNCGGEKTEKASAAGGCGEKTATVESASASGGCEHSSEGCDGCGMTEAVPKSEAGGSSDCSGHGAMKAASADSDGCGGGKASSKKDGGESKPK